MGRGRTATNLGPQAQSLAAPRYSGDGVPKTGLDTPAVSAVWNHAVLWRGSQGNRSAESGPGGGSRLCLEPDRSCHSMPSRGSGRRRNGRIPLGCRTQKSLAADGATGLRAPGHLGAMMSSRVLKACHPGLCEESAQVLSFRRPRFLAFARKDKLFESPVLGPVSEQLVSAATSRTPCGRGKADQELSPSL